ncbi:hypothetical protein [Nocardioides bruguierae]|uniref:hypothetical protein n=1 Tax=Nocardioides bruguierae TaxID=2945102 RepID=UPI0020220383|nr:hypothetical protein [Nocardioides bruguierae]MCL8024369.1 hypothetical protein [Nocardioides bruguierae]
MRESFVRVQATYRGRLGVEVGIFVAVDHLRRAGRLSPEETERYLEIDDWFDAHLPHPGFYADGNTIGAVTWFREPVPAEMADQVSALRAILDTHGVAHEEVRSVDPGTEVYRDAYQVGVLPHERREPAPVPPGTVLAPTSPGSKRAVAASTVRTVVLDDVDGAETSVVVAGLRRQGYRVLGRGEAGPDADRANVLVVGDDPSADVRWTAAQGTAALGDALAARGVDARLGRAD